MTITTPSHDRVPAASVSGDIPAQRSAPAPAPAVVPRPARTAPPSPTRAAVTALARVAVPAPARVTGGRTGTPWEITTAPVPRRAPAVESVPLAEPVRVDGGPRRRWAAAVGGLAAGLTLGTLGAVGAVVALSVSTAATATTAAPETVVAAAPASVSPNVSVPGRALTAVGDGTWQVGVDVAPGTYMTTGAKGGATCRHALRRTRTGEDVTAHVASGLDTVVLTGDDTWFSTSGCATWNRVG